MGSFGISVWNTIGISAGKKFLSSPLSQSLFQIFDQRITKSHSLVIKMTTIIQIHYSYLTHAFFYHGKWVDLLDNLPKLRYHGIYSALRPRTEVILLSQRKEDQANNYFKMTKASGLPYTRSRVITLPPYSLEWLWKRINHSITSQLDGVIIVVITCRVIHLNRDNFLPAVWRKATCNKKSDSVHLDNKGDD